MANPLPYSIQDVLLNPGVPAFMRQQNIKVAEALEARAEEFYCFFGVHLIFFLDDLSGFDYAKFVDAVLVPVPDGISYNTATASRYGVRAAELIRELIYAGSESNG
jgi:hypothetical protein